MTSTPTPERQKPARLNYVVIWGESEPHQFRVPFHTLDEAIEKAADLLRAEAALSVTIDRI